MACFDRGSALARPRGSLMAPPKRSRHLPREIEDKGLTIAVSLRRTTRVASPTVAQSLPPASLRRLCSCCCVTASGASRMH